MIDTLKKTSSRDRSFGETIPDDQLPIRIDYIRDARR
jgi:hypothetical protein